MKALNTFIATTRDSRELKRALAVKSTLYGRTWQEVAEELGVCASFIGKWRDVYEQQGVEGLKLGYKGSSGFLSPQAKADIIDWLLQDPHHQQVGRLSRHIQDEYGVTYRSRQSYYALLHEAKLSWKKTQKRNPKTDPKQVQATRETLKKKTMQEADAIVKKDTVVLCVDECHLLWGDTLGYAWGPRGERIEVPLLNERERQTYYGAVNVLTGRSVVMPADTGNGEFTVTFLKTLRQAFQGRRLVILWDRAPYHRGSLVKSYLTELQGDCPAQERLIQLECFAPNAPEQNPMEDVWLATKRWIRQHWWACETFQHVRHQFVTFIRRFILKTKKFEWYFDTQMI